MTTYVVIYRNVWQPGPRTQAEIYRGSSYDDALDAVVTKLEDKTNDREFLIQAWEDNQLQGTDRVYTSISHPYDRYQKLMRIAKNRQDQKLLGRLDHIKTRMKTRHPSAFKNR